MKLRLSRTQKWGLLAGGLVAATAAAGAVFWTSRTTAEEFITAKVERGTIRHTVNATGTLQAVTTVQVGSQVSGTISALYADFNSIVKKDQIVAQLDPAIFQAQVGQARANLEQARANLTDAQAKVQAAQSAVENQRAGVSSASANLQALKAQRDDAKSQLQRQEALASSGVITQRDIDTARTNYQAAEARYNQAVAQLEQARVSEQSATRAGLAQAQAQVKQAQAQVQQTEAALRLSEVNLSHTTIRSPIDGVVVSRNVDVGQTVAASLQAPTLFTIANDLTQMQVIANIDQADIGVITSSDRISFTVDAFPGQNFGGTIRQIRLNPQNTQNVVTYNVVIDVNNPDQKLKPGMTANLTVTIAERNDVLKLPNAALRFIPQGFTPEKIRELMRAERERRGEARPAGAENRAEKPAGAENQAPSPAASQPGAEREPRQGKGRDKRGEGQPAASQPAQGQAPGQGAPRQGGEGGPRREGGGGSFSGMQTAAVIQGQSRIVWVLGPDNKPQPRRIKLGITDGVSTEMAEGDLKEGDLVIVGQNRSGEGRTQSGQRPPGFGGPGGPGGGGFGGGRPR